MPKYTVNSPLKHDGERYKVGAVIELEKDVADGLVNIGTLTEGVAESAAGGKGGSKNGGKGGAKK